MRHRWTDPNVQAELAAQSAMGMSATEIARSMGLGRNAVKSAMTRYGLFAASRPVTLSGSFKEGKEENGYLN